MPDDVTHPTVFPVLALLVAGCTGAEVFRSQPSPALPADASGDVAYRCGCADVLDVSFADRPALDGLSSVGIDGKLPLGAAGTVQAAGATTDEVRAAVAVAAGVDPDRVQVRIAEPRAGRVFVTGPEAGARRTVPYYGAEPVVAFLWRVGAVKQGSTDLHDISVTRSNVAAGGPPQVFKVDVEAVVLDGNHRTDVLLRPSDQVTIGETNRSRFSRLLPAWARPFYRKLVGLLPPDGWPWAAPRTPARFEPTTVIPPRQPVD